MSYEEFPKNKFFDDHFTIIGVAVPKPKEKTVAAKTKTPALAFPVRPLYEIAREIRAEWKNVWFGAVPYLEALERLDSINDRYIAESAREQVERFLGNAGTWKGEAARRIKAELKQLVGRK